MSEVTRAEFEEEKDNSGCALLALFLIITVIAIVTAFINHFQDTRIQRLTERVEQLERAQ